MTDRRTFLEGTAAVGALAAISDMDSLFAQEAGASAASGIPDLVAVRNGTRAEMVRKAVDTLGGMKAFVKPGQTVVIKPNIGWNKAPEFGSNTHPETVATLVELCKQAGAKEVRVFDHCCHNGAYEGSGVKEAVEKAGGVMVDGGNEGQYVQTENPKAKNTNDLVERKTLLASRDIVAIDAAGAALLNKAGKIRHVQLGEEMGLGTADLSKLNIRRISMA